MAVVVPPHRVRWVEQYDVVVAGAGGAGLASALAAADQGARVVVFEKAAQCGGNTRLSAGLIAAAGTRWQKGLTGATPEGLARNILRKNGGRSDPELTAAICRRSAEVLEWLADRAGIELELLGDYKYADHDHYWLHAPPSRSGRDLIEPLERAAAQHPRITLRRATAVTGLVQEEGGRVVGVTWGAADGTGPPADGAHAPEDCASASTGRADGGKTAKSLTATASPRVILATDGFGAERRMLAQYVPGMAGALHYGAEGSTGDGIRWAVEAGAQLEHMGAYQAHPSIVTPEQVFLTSYVLNHGGIQVNRAGRRFGDETQGYGAHAADLLRQPGGIAFEIFDERIYRAALTHYPRFGEVVAAGVIRRAESLAELARVIQDGAAVPGTAGETSTVDGSVLDPAVLEQTIAEYNRAMQTGGDPFGRPPTGRPLEVPYYVVRVTAALVQTLGGLRVNARAQVLGVTGRPIPGLYACGGTAAGLAGPTPEGYLAGTGLLTAFVLGYVAGQLDAAPGTD